MPERWYGPRPEYKLAHFHAHSHPLPEFPALTHVHDARCMPGHEIPPHIHETFEICYFYGGRGQWNAEGRSYALKPGDIYIIKPGEVHGGGTDPLDPLQIYVVGIDPGALPMLPWSRPADPALKEKALKQIEDVKQLGVPVLNAPLRDVAEAVGETRTLSDDFRALNERVIPGGAGAEQYFQRILAELDQPCPGDPQSRALKVMMVQALLVELLVFIARCYAAHRQLLSSAPPHRMPERAEIHDIQTWLRTRVADPPPLAEMAERAGFSPAHFAVVFKQETGMTPLEFMTSARIEEAAARLAASDRMSITDIAMDLGFSSSQYFSLVFKKYKGCTPKEWRAKRY